MKVYDCFAGCLVDDIVLHYYVKAKNLKSAWLKGYIYFNKCSVADTGDIDCKRVKDYTKITKIN